MEIITYVKKSDDPELASSLLGIQACLGTAWWLLISLFYFNNTSTDPDLTTIGGSTVAIPILWWWERMAESGGAYVYLAFCLMWNFVVYGVVSVVEMVAWIMYLMGDMKFARFYFSTIGYWGSIVTYAFPWVFAVCQLASTMRGITFSFPGVWTLALFIIGSILWIVCGQLHIFFVPAFVMRIDELTGANCMCSIPEVPALA